MSAFLIDPIAWKKALDNSPSLGEMRDALNGPIPRLENSWPRYDDAVMSTLKSLHWVETPSFALWNYLYNVDENKLNRRRQHQANRWAESLEQAIQTDKRMQIKWEAAYMALASLIREIVTQQRDVTMPEFQLAHKLMAKLERARVKLVTAHHTQHTMRRLLRGLEGQYGITPAEQAQEEDFYLVPDDDTVHSDPALM